MLVMMGGDGYFGGILIVEYLIIDLRISLYDVMYILQIRIWVERCDCFSFSSNKIMISLLVHCHLDEFVSSLIRKLMKTFLDFLRYSWWGLVCLLCRIWQFAPSVRTTNKVVVNSWPHRSVCWSLPCHTSTSNACFVSRPARKCFREPSSQNWRLRSVRQEICGAGRKARRTPRTSGRGRSIACFHKSAAFLEGPEQAPIPAQQTRFRTPFGFEVAIEVVNACKITTCPPSLHREFYNDRKGRGTCYWYRSRHNILLRGSVAARSCRDNRKWPRQPNHSLVRGIHRHRKADRWCRQEPSRHG